MKEIKLLLKFLKAFDSCQVHNMLALMLNVHFKSLWIVESFVGDSNVIHLTIEHDVKEVIHVLMTKFYQLNFTIQTMYVMTSDGHAIEIEKEKFNIFSVGASMEKFSHTFVIGELSLF